MPPIQDVLMLAALAVASVTDLRTGKIYNTLTLPLWALGIAINATLADWTVGVYGLIAGFAVHYPLWILGVEKGGDAKLIIGIGALMGWQFMFELTFWFGIVYLPTGLLMLAIKGRLGNLKRVLEYRLAQAQGQTDLGDEPEPTMLRTAPIIAIAGLFAYLTPWLEFIVSS